MYKRLVLVYHSGMNLESFLQMVIYLAVVALDNVFTLSQRLLVDS
jgi:hypothetical protein